jgi:hypothetical protein
MNKTKIKVIKNFGLRLFGKPINCSMLKMLKIMLIFLTLSLEKTNT